MTETPIRKTKWHDKLSRIDRRIIYLLLTVLVALPFFVRFKIPQNIMSQTRQLYDSIENLPAGDKAVIVCCDYTPQTYPECHPMAIAILRHCFRRRIPVIGMSFDAQAPGLAVEAFTAVAAEINRDARSPADSVIYGRDYVYLGWKSGFVGAMLDMGESIRGVFPRDYYRAPVDSFPLMQRVDNYKMIAMAIIIAASDYPEYWILYAQSRYGVRIAAGLTAVMAPKYFPYVQTGQLSGMISGMKGAAEYEQLILDRGYTRYPGQAETGMNSQSLVHLLIIAFIVIGNIGYFLSGRKK